MVQALKKVRVLVLVQLVVDQAEQEHPKGSLQLKELAQLVMVVGRLLQTLVLFAMVMDESENKGILK